ncbi:ATPase/histidine kinase/DNA gyrase B/HSP90 domain protein [Clostridiales bacterium oral taxon 876 str. F0540]|nr:ATPase/histidine kinase/DNA gyrase B/HSP90 domain protein [Clostridiales bacterium oral taxon 876 str. F0540]
MISKKYFSNPELKISSFILLYTVALFLIITSIVLKSYTDNLKRDYTRSLGAVTARIIEKNPELEGEIVPLVTKEISKEEADKGEDILKQYGITKDLENELFPYINKISFQNKTFIICIFTILAVILFMFNYIQYGYFYSRIRRLTLAAKKVVDGNYDIVINENKEGDFSKLAVSFNSMREIIRNNISQLKKEKQFLVDLLSDISHQLKTPLSSMIVYNDIMLSKELDKNQRQTFLLSNQNQLNRMNWLIQSMLKLAKLDARAIELRKEKQSLNETVEEAVDALESKASENNVKIIRKCNYDIYLEHDRLWLEEALINIIKNGIEHTPSGGTISIDLIENPVYRRIIIEDTGEGIEERDLPNIFKRFYKAKTSRKADSVGIGLALAKSIVEAHNGLIEAQSKIGLGTKFTITFLKY